MKINRISNNQNNVAFKAKLPEEARNVLWEMGKITGATMIRVTHFQNMSPETSYGFCKFSGDCAEVLLDPKGAMNNPANIFKYIQLGLNKVADKVLKIINK